MWGTNLRIGGVVIGTILFYTMLANVIPQVESEVPEELRLSPDVTPEELVAIGEQLYFGAGGCAACHGTGTRAPHLLVAEGPYGAIGARCGDRVPGLDCKEYLWQAMVEPNAYVVEGYLSIMPDMRRSLSEPQIWAIIAFMQDQGGEVTVTAEDIGDVGDPAPVASPAAGAPAAAAAGVAVSGTDPLELLRAHQCLLCHQLAGDGGPIGPPLDGVGARLDAATLRQAILDPEARIAEGYEAFAGTMPTNYGEVMTAAQLEAVVQYLAGLR
jgi:mono/diheme cytochrome c family protein